MKRGWVFLLLLVTTVARAQNVPAPAAEVKFGQIDGKAVSALDNSPLKGVEIMLMGEGGVADARASKSDAEGRFSLPKVPAGRYYVRIEKPGFVVRRVSRSPLANGASLELSAGETLADVVVQLWPSAVIRGKVLDPSGEPVIGAGVTALRPGRGQRASRWDPVNSASTDDKGDFRLFGLAPGRYLVRASPGAGTSAVEAPIADSAAARETRPVPTYYPATADVREATPITLKPGDEFPINIMLTTGRTVHVRGTVGGTSPTTIVTLTSVDQVVVRTQIAQVKDGKFDISGVIPGRYLLQATNVENDLRQPQMARQNLEVGPDGLDNVVIVIGGRAQLKATVVAEGGKLDFKKLYLSLVPDDLGDADGIAFGYGDGGEDRGRVNADGTSTFKNLEAGRFRLVVTAIGPGIEDWYTKKIRLGTQDVTDSAIEVAPDASLSAEVVLSAAGATVEGATVDDKEKPWPNVSVYAVPEEKRRKTPDAWGHAATDQRGRFTMRGLAPGNYTLIALEEPPREPRDADAFKNILKLGQSVRLEERSRKSVSVKVIPTDDDESQ